MKRVLGWFVLIVGVVSGLLGWAWMQGYRLVLTPSVPVGLWRVEPMTGPLARGQFVWVCPPDTAVFRQARRRGYLPAGDCPGGFMHMLKPVAAVAGDVVTVSRRGIAVNGRRLTNTLPMLRDGQGRRMPVFTDGRYPVTVGRVWLVSSYHPKSFDSRYFGPVSVRQIQGRAKPILVMD